VGGAKKMSSHWIPLIYTTYAVSVCREVWRDCVPPKSPLFGRSRPRMWPRPAKKGEISGAVQPPPNPHRVSRVNDTTYAVIHLIEIGRPLRVAVVREQPRDLARHHARQRQFGQRVLTEEPDLLGLCAGCRRAAAQLAQKKDFVGVKRVGRVAVPIAIVERQQLDRAGLV